MGNFNIENEDFFKNRNCQGLYIYTFLLFVKKISPSSDMALRKKYITKAFLKRFAHSQMGKRKKTALAV